MYLLFHKEECPYCAKVRQFMSDENICYVSINSPNDGPAREILKKLGDKNQVPFLVDTDTGEMLYESDEIIAYLQ